MTQQLEIKSGTIEQLKEFINKAEKLGKYPSNTAAAMFSASKVVEEGLLEDEPTELNYIVEHLEEIFHRQLKRSNLAPRSLQTYMGRVRRAISDFQIYGQDSKTLHSWKPKIVQRAIKGRNGPARSEDSAINFTGPLPSQTVAGLKGTGLRTLVWSLRPDLAITVQLPVDLNKNDVERYKKLLDLELELTAASQK